MRPAALALLVLLASCGYRPPRFADADPVVDVDDQAPIARPARTEYPDWARYSEAYVRRTLIRSLDPARIPEAGDVNAFDEVPRSSWFEPARALLDGYVVSGAPTAPFSVGVIDPDDADAPRTLVDSRRRNWHVYVDPHGRVGLRTGAGAIASRLVYALGYRAAEAHVISLDGARALAVRWPGVRSPVDDLEVHDLGPTRPSSTADFDPNDVVPHEERRTLRAFALISDWLGIDQIGPGLLRDVYVGSSGRGFVQHYVVGLEDALGAGRLVLALRGARGEDPPRNAWVALGTFGLAPKESFDPAETPHLGVGIFPRTVDPLEHDLRVPFQPADDALVGDVYWIAKRIAAIPDGTIVSAVAAAELPTEAARYLEQALKGRRDAVSKFAMGFVTPLELAGSATVGEEREVKLTDVAILRGYADAKTTSYVVHCVDGAGDEIGERFDVTPNGAAVTLPIPAGTFDGRDYVVVRIRAVRGDKLAPRLAELHLRAKKGIVRVRGVRH